ncbi:hypothetical protein Y1Q_0002112 [Alligator mississippiensis]|uniref:Uncharacterized protein n=1 Tax=Alligator mississippiensis TaxID=8496 RepID=A0A151MIZ8_ALLMI|nr:hypothetical protein Y1Q_0002112 [Alligator mississippiensis]
MGNGGQLTPLGIRKRPVTFSCQLLDFRSCLASCWRRDQRTLRTPSACTDVYDRLNVTLTQVPLTGTDPSNDSGKTSIINEI